MTNNKAFSLIEVLVFTAVLGLFFVAALSVATFNIRNMKIQEHKILATRYAEEATEWLKQEKEDRWYDELPSVGFSSRDTSGGPGKNYCLNSLVWTVATLCTTYGLGTPTIYKRELLIKNISTTQIEATVTVLWKDMGTDLKVEIKTVFKLLE